MDIGTKVVNRKGKRGIIADVWNPHLINPNIFAADAPTGYSVIWDDGTTGICLFTDFINND